MASSSRDREKDSLIDHGQKSEDSMKWLQGSSYYGTSCNSLASVSFSTTVRTVETKTYWWRWYILFLFCLIAAMENICWNTWGPIESSSRTVFGWSKGTVSLLADWGAITFVLAVFPSSWLLDVRGLRSSVILCGFFLTVGCGLRAITSQSSVATPLIHLGQFVIGLGGPVAQSAATLLSSTWFPPHQRTTATAIASLAVYFGTAISFVIGPAIVEEISPRTNLTNIKAYEEKIDKVRGDIMQLMYVEFGISALLMILAIFTFPNKPPLPPSTTAAMQRVDYKTGLKKLLRNPQFQLIAFLYGITTGVYSAWCSDLALNLEDFNVDNKFAGWLGFWAIIAGAVSGITLSLVADYLGGFMKPILILLFVTATAGFALFSLVCVQVIPTWKSLFYVTSIIGGLCLNGAIPLFFELSVESSYPVAEGINTGFMTFSNNVYCLIFLSIPLIPGAGSKWMNWFLTGSCAICIPMMFLFKERYRRLEIDVKAEERNSDAVNS